MRAFAALLATTFAAALAAADDPAPAGKPTLFLVGDSTVRTGTKGQQGWGDRLAAHFDPTEITVANHAIGGRSSRTFITEGRWGKGLAAAQPGGLVLIQLRHNDRGPLHDPHRG